MRREVAGMAKPTTIMQTPNDPASQAPTRVWQMLQSTFLTKVGCILANPDSSPAVKLSSGRTCVTRPEYMTFKRRAGRV